MNNCLLCEGKYKNSIWPAEVYTDSAPLVNENFQFQNFRHSDTDGIIIDEQCFLFCMEHRAIFEGKLPHGICPAEAPKDTTPNLNEDQNLQIRIEKSSVSSVACNITTAADYDDNPESRRMSLAQENLSADKLVLNIYYQNTRGLRTKVDSFFLAVMDADYHVIVLTETWLNDTFFSTQLFGHSYTVYRNDRDVTCTGKKRGGGVLIAVSNNLRSKGIPINVANDLEQLWVRISTANGDMCIGVIYLAPEYAQNPNYIQKHIDCVGEVVNSLEVHDSHILFGDYNQPNLVWKKTP